MPANEQGTSIGTPARHDQARPYDSPSPNRPPPSVPLASGSLEKTALPTTKGYVTDVNKSRPTPWYRTTKGIAIIIVVAFVVVGVGVGVGVGVAVGVTQSKKSQSTSQLTDAERGSTGGGVQSNEGATVAQPMTTSSLVPTIITSAGSGGAGGNETSGNNNGNTPINSGVPAFTGR